MLFASYAPQTCRSSRSDYGTCKTGHPIIWLKRVLVKSAWVKRNKQIIGKERLLWKNTHTQWRPRMHNNTAKLLAAAGEGAVSAGASTETIDLYKLNFTDCRSCLACKNKRWPSPGSATGKMAWRKRCRKSMRQMPSSSVHPFSLGNQRAWSVPLWFDRPSRPYPTMIIRAPFRENRCLRDPYHECRPELLR